MKIFVPLKEMKVVKNHICNKIISPCGSFLVDLNLMEKSKDFHPCEDYCLWIPCILQPAFCN